jgi:hypothetical protein
MTRTGQEFPDAKPNVTKKRRMRALLIFLVSLMTARPSPGAATLIGPGTLNGSFESGSASPWLGGVQVIYDPAFATDGSWYGALQAAGSGTARQIAFQFLPANRSDGLTFSVTFDARIGTTGFDTLGVELLGSIETPVTFTTLSSSQWQTFHTEFHLPDSWTGGNISLQLLYSKTGTTSGTTYTGFLDNIILQQIPEPSTASLVCLAGLFLAFAPVPRR